MENYQSLIVIGGSVLALAAVIIAIITFISRSYIKVAPNQVAVFYGRKYKTKDGQEVGFKAVTGGARLKIPIIESVQFLDLSVFSIELEVRKAPNKDGVLVNLKGVANVKILSDEAALMSACERFLGKTPKEIESIAFKNLEGHLRSIAGTLTVEDLVGDRTKLSQSVQADASADLQKLGLGIDLLTIQEVTDDSEYIEQLGKKRTAEVTRDAAIGKAEAEKQSTISTTTALKEAALTENQNLVGIAESEKEREVKKANFTAQVAKEQATAEQAGPLATAEAMKGVVIAEQEVEKTKIEKATEVAEAEVKRTEKKLESEIIKPAEAQKRASIVNAEAAKEVKTIDAEADKSVVQVTAEATKQRQILEGEGYAQSIKIKAEADATAIKVKALAEAEGTKAKLEAEAVGIKAKLEAEADGMKAKLLAEAEGVLKKAEAYAKLDETGKLMQILEVIEKVAPQLVKEFAGVMEAAAKPLGNVKNISIVDFGSGDATGKFGETVPGIVANFISKASAMGLDVNGILSKLGVDGTKFLEKANIEIKSEEDNGSKKE